MTYINDPAFVRGEYTDETGLLGRRGAYQFAEGPNAPELAFEAVAEGRPSRVLEVGCGPGELSERIANELDSRVVAIDISPRMVELARARGVEAHVGDVQELSFTDGEFDCAVAAWMLYHVPNVDRALSELARVLRPGGRLVAVTNYLDHLRELRELLGAGPRTSPFSGDDGEAVLASRFRRVEARDCRGVVRFPTRRAVLDYVEYSASFFGNPSSVPEFELPLVVRTHPVIFIAEK